MLDQENEYDDVPTDIHGVPKLPRALREKLFATHGGYEHLRFPGDDIYNEIDRPIGSVVITIRNPTENTAKISHYVGADADFQVRAERALIPPKFRASERTMLSLLGQLTPVRVEFLRVLLELAPGATAQVPAVWLKGLRHIRKDTGLVEGGSFPLIEVVGEENPPTLHHTFRSEGAVKPSSTARRRP